MQHPGVQPKISAPLVERTRGEGCLKSLPKKTRNYDLAMQSVPPFVSPCGLRHFSMVPRKDRRVWKAQTLRYPGCGPDCGPTPEMRNPKCKHKYEKRQNRNKKIAPMCLQVPDTKGTLVEQTQFKARVKANFKANFMSLHAVKWLQMRNLHDNILQPSSFQPFTWKFGFVLGLAGFLAQFVWDHP
jgi:hypothetical protein